MCGIFGYYSMNVPQTLKKALSFVLNGLTKLEYRGYDSAGLATFNDGGFDIIKTTGNVDNLSKKVKEYASRFEDKVNASNSLIGHTRWATHGVISEINSHPHTSDASNEFVAVHNGIINNYTEIKHFLADKVDEMQSQTDSEVIPKLFKYIYDTNKSLTFMEIAKSICRYLQGTYAFIIVSKHFPNEMICCRKGSPLLVGVKNDDDDTLELFLSSDMCAITEHTSDVVHLEDNDIMHIVNNEYKIYNVASRSHINRSASKVQISNEENSMGEFTSYLEKEIHEQPSIIERAFSKRVKKSIEFPEIDKSKIDECNRIILVACGTSYHSCLEGRYIMEQTLKKSVVAEISSDFVDRNYQINAKDVCMFLSQSGETADTLHALRMCKEKGAYCIAITNREESTISKEAGCSIDLKAGYEVSVASTKAYTTQIATLCLLSTYLSNEDVSSTLACYENLGSQMKNQISEYSKLIPLIANSIQSYSSVLFIGRGLDYATALEGALKMKEVAYVHCEGILAGELKHGPLALIDDKVLNIVFVIRGAVHEKMLSVLEQLIARGSKMIVVCNEDDVDVLSLVPRGNYVIQVPRTSEYLQPILNILPMQLLAYHLAVNKGYNVDRPRNLAKSVTVTD